MNKLNNTDWIGVEQSLKGYRCPDKAQSRVESTSKNIFQIHFQRKNSSKLVSINFLTAYCSCKSKSTALTAYTYNYCKFRLLTLSSNHQVIYSTFSIMIKQHELSPTPFLIHAHNFCQSLYLRFHDVG